MIKALIVILLATYPYSLFSQNECKCDSFEYEKYFDEKLTGNIFKQRINSKIQYFNYWTKGDVVLGNGLVAKSRFLRYNGLVDELLWLRTTDYQTAVVNKKNVDGFFLYNKDGSELANFKKMKIKEWYTIDSSFVYMQILTQGPVALYVHRKIIATDNIDTKFDESNNYYLVQNNQIKSVLLNRRNLYKLVDKPRMKKVIRSEHLRVKNEAHMQRAIELYNKSLAENL